MQAQVANGVMDQSAQLAQPQAAGFDADAAANQLWRTAQDIPALRQNIFREIYNLFVKKQPNQTQNERFPTFCHRLEQELFNNARSKEEYLDLQSLEPRLQTVARNMANTKNNAPAAAAQPMPVANGNIQPGMMPQAQVQTFNTAATGAALLTPAQLGAAPASAMPAAGGISMLPTPAIATGADGNIAALQQQVPNPSTNGMVPTDAGAQSLLQAQLQQANVQASQAPMSGAPAAAPQQVMSNGVPVIRGSRAQGQQQVGQVPNASQLGVNGITPAGAAAAAMPQVPAIPGFIPTGATGPMIPTSPMIPVAGNATQASGMVMVQQSQQAAAANGPVGTGMMPVSAGGMVPVSNVTGAPLSGVDANLIGGLCGLGAGDVTQQQQQAGQQRAAGEGGEGGTVQERQLQERQLYIQKQQRWLLFLRHCAKCQMSESECQFGRSCRVGKELWQHILSCNETNCQFPRCHSSKDLLKHHQKCQNPSCPICTPVKEYVKRIRGQGGGSTSAGTSSQMQQMQLGGWDKSSQLAGQKRLASGMLVGQQGLGRQPSMGLVPTTSMGAIGGLADNKRVKVEGDKNILAKNTGTSLVETFDDRQIETHINKMRITMQQQQQRQPMNLMQQAFNPADACAVCNCTKLLFEPPLVYCTSCGQKIKRSQVFYCTQADAEVRGAWCHTCFSDAKGDRIVVEGSINVRKADLIKKKNDEEMEESWVQCDYCEQWVHQICGLFNKGRNDQNVHYLCPECLLKGSRQGLRSRMTERPQSMLTAKDLPHCTLSRHLEKRLEQMLDQERGQRALSMAQSPSQVQTAENLTVRVINNVVKHCEVKPKFYETFQQEGSATEFPYRQKVVLLFQQQDGVDVCLYCMYVQEYGADCPAPNTNVVYLSYIDSVKYFQPEISVPNGSGGTVALRTFVYHQILLGYLDFVKKLGFEHLYIWACPPLQGDDYILYCHPQKQKTPRSDRLRMWYHDMLRQAKAEGIVVHLSTLWDTYFEGGRDHRMERCSAAHIPYLEGDYWPGEAENLLMNIQEGGRLDGTKGNKGMGRKANNKGKRYGNGPATTDEQLMARLGEVLGGNMREDFIVVHLQEPCSMCRGHVTEPNAYIHRYHPSASSKPVRERQFDGIKLESPSTAPVGPTSFFQICHRCYGEEMSRLSSGCKSRLPAGLTLQDLVLEPVKGVKPMPDPDVPIDCEFFETRQAFLSLCQGNHYQFDTIRRAKHSSMMVLYHLHNPNAPAFSSTCNRCQRDIEPGNGLRCTICSDFDMCISCKREGHTHEHPLVLQTANMDETQHRYTEKERQERAQSLQRTMALLVHACNCKAQACPQPSCAKVKMLFSHAMSCQQRVTGGCPLCRKMWFLLNLHAKSCTRADCNVPRCRELKELRRRQAQRMEAKRRVAYQAMLRNQSNMAD